MLGSGQGADVIRSTLRTQGWSDDVIEQVFSGVDKVPVPPSPPIPPPSTSGGSWAAFNEDALQVTSAKRTTKNLLTLALFIFVGILALGGGAFAAYPEFFSQTFVGIYKDAGKENAETKKVDLYGPDMSTRLELEKGKMTPKEKALQEMLARDAMRDAHLGRLQLELELYYDSHQKAGTRDGYPASLGVILDNLSDSDKKYPLYPIDPKDNKPYAYLPLEEDDKTPCTRALCPSYFLGVSLELDKTEYNTVTHELFLDTDDDRTPSGGKVSGADTAGCFHEVGRYCFDRAPS